MSSTSQKNEPESQNSNSKSVSTFKFKQIGVLIDYCTVNNEDGDEKIDIYLKCQGYFAQNNKESKDKKVSLIRYINVDSIGSKLAELKTFQKFQKKLGINERLTIDKWPTKENDTPFVILTFDDYINGNVTINDNERID